MHGNQLPINDTEKQIIRDMYAQGYGLRKIAKEIQRSPQAVSNFCEREHLFFGPSIGEDSNQKRFEKLREQRLITAEKVLSDILRMRERAWDQYEIVVNTSEGTEILLLDEPPLKEQSDAYKAIEAMVRTFNTLMEGLDTNGTESAKSVLSNMLTGLQKLMADDPNAGLGPMDQDQDDADAGESLDD